MIWLENILAAFAAGLVAISALSMVVLVCVLVSMMTYSEGFRLALGVFVVLVFGASIMELFDLWAT